MNVSNFEARALTRQTARAQCGQTALVRNACSNVGLVHELGQLGRTEELLNGCHDGADVNQGLRRDVVRLLHAHALAYNTLHTGKADAELILDQFANRADTTVAEVVDVVYLNAFGAIMETHDVAHGCDDVFLRKRGGVVFRIELKLLIDLVTANLCQVVALGVEEQAIKQRTSRVDRRGLARTETTIQLDKRLFLGSGRVAVEGADHHLGIAEDIDDLFTRFSDTECTQKKRSRLLTLTVDAYGKDIALVGFELEPCTARRDDLRVVDGLVGCFVALGREVHARAADQLRYNNTLGAVDDEGAAGRHQREVAHEDVLLFDLACFAIDEADFSKERCLVGHVTFLAFIYAILGLTKFMLAEFNTHIFGVGFDGADVCESIRQTIIHELLEAFRLDCDQIRHVHDGWDLREAPASPITAGGIGVIRLNHESFPPSLQPVVLQKDTI